MEKNRDLNFYPSYVLLMRNKRKVICVKLRISLG